MPIVVRPEDIKLSKRKLRKDPLYKLGLEEGKQIGLEKGKQIGLEEGKQIGLEEGKQIGLEEGKQIGFQEGEVIGIEKGRQIGIQEGKQIGFQEGKQIGELEFAQKMVITITEDKLGYVPKGLEERVKDVKDRDFLHALIKKLISSEKVLEVLKEELNI